MNPLLNLLILWPKYIASYFKCAGSLIVGFTVGHVFTGWGKLQNLEYRFKKEKTS